MRFKSLTIPKCHVIYWELMCAPHTHKWAKWKMIRLRVKCTPKFTCHRWILIPLRFAQCHKRSERKRKTLTYTHTYERNGIGSEDKWRLFFLFFLVSSSLLLKLEKRKQRDKKNRRKAKKRENLLAVVQKSWVDVHWDRSSEIMCTCLLFCHWIHLPSFHVTTII